MFKYEIGDLVTTIQLINTPNGVTFEVYANRLITEAFYNTNLDDSVWYKLEGVEFEIKEDELNESIPKFNYGDEVGTSFDDDVDYIDNIQLINYIYWYKLKNSKVWINEFEIYLNE